MALSRGKFISIHVMLSMFFDDNAINDKSDNNDKEKTTSMWKHGNNHASPKQNLMITGIY